MCHILALLDPSNLQSSDKLTSSSRGTNTEYWARSQDVRAWIGRIVVLRDYSSTLVNSHSLDFVDYCNKLLILCYMINKFGSLGDYAIG